MVSNRGRWSRREAAALIRAGRVCVDGKIVLQREEKFPDTVCIQVDGEVISGDRWIYLMLNKPAGLVSATEDPKETTVLSLLSDDLRRMGVFPAGRLDKDTVGLLLLTNDGALAHALLAPRRHVEKRYQVTVSAPLDAEDETAFQNGIRLRDGTQCMRAQLVRVGENEGIVTLREGKYHQIKRMFAARGKPVKTLRRVAFGPLLLDERLKPGEWRALTQEEIESLRKISQP